MGYPRFSCTSELTWEQATIFQSHIEYRDAARTLANPEGFFYNPDVDKWENDNHRQTASEIFPEGGLPPIQLHSFHRDRNATSPQQELDQDDWVNFRVGTIPGSVQDICIAVRPVSGKPFPNGLNFSLYEEGSNTPMQSWSATSNDHSEIFSLPTDKRYFLRLNNGAYDATPPQFYLGVFRGSNLFDILFGPGGNGGNGQYFGLTVNGNGFASTIDGDLDGVVCNGDILTFDVASPPPSGLTYDWTAISHTSGLTMALSESGNQATVNFTGKGEGTIRLRVEQNGIRVLTVEQRFWFGNPSGGVLVPSNPDEEFCRPHIDPALGYYTLEGAEGVKSVSWFLNGNWVGSTYEAPHTLTAEKVLSGPNPTAGQLGTNNLYVTISNNCGNATFSSSNHAATFEIVNDQTCASLSRQAEVSDSQIQQPTSTLTFFPNPTEETIRIVLDERFIGKEMLISVYNAQGQFVNTEISVGQTQARVGLQNLPAGIYFVELGSQTAYERLKVVKK